MVLDESLQQRHPFIIVLNFAGGHLAAQLIKPCANKLRRGLNNCIDGDNKLAPHLGHDSIRITQLFPPSAWNSTDEVPSPDGNYATLWKGSARAADFPELPRETYNDSTLREIVHSHGERIFDSQRKILQGTVMEAVNCH